MVFIEKRLQNDWPECRRLSCSTLALSLCYGFKLTTCIGNRMHFDSPEELAERMLVAIEMAERGIRADQSPFGAAVFDNKGELVIAEHNRVKELNDPSAHAEVMAIRSTCSHLGRRDLSGYWMFATCEPCPMCSAAIVFAGIRHVVFGASVVDAKAAGYTELQLPSSDTFDRVDDSIILHSGVEAANCRNLFSHRTR